MTSKKGKLIVIDGSDGSGKTTQVKLLSERFKQAGFTIEVADFPQYGQKSAGIIEEYLSGKYGEAENVNPYVAALMYSIDRYDASFKIKKWLEQGKVVISNRYTTSNMAHQGGKIRNPLERKAFFDWIKNLEEKIFDIPKPDLTLFLHIDAKIAQKLTKQRNKVDWAGKIKDIHEENIQHLEQAGKTYIEIAKNDNNIILFSCTNNNQLLAKEVINNYLWEKISEQINIKKNKSHADKVFTNHNLDNLLNKNDSRPKLKIKKLNNQARTPDWSSADNSLNIYSYDYHSLLPKEIVEFKTGINIDIPPDYSGIIINYDLSKLLEISILPFMISPNSIKEIVIKIINTSEDIVNISPGNIIAKMILHKTTKPLIIDDTFCF